MITVEVKGAAELAKYFDALPKKITDAFQRAIDEMGQDAANSIVQAATFDNFTGETRNLTRYVAREDGGVVLMPLHGIYVDRATPHWVSMNQNRPQLLQWGLQAQFSRVREEAAAVASGRLKSASLFVRPHPFINKGFNRAKESQLATLQRHVEQAFN